MSIGKIYETQFGKMYQILLNKVLKKERTEEEFMQVDELANGKSMDKILRKPEKEGHS